MAKENQEEEKKAFIIAPLGPEGSDIRRRINGIIKVLLIPVLEKFKLKPLPSHEIDESGSITRQIIEHLLNDDLVICDLTENNPNVMYELAIRHAVQLPVVLIAENDTKIPFDIGDQRTVFFKDDPLGLEEFKPILEKKIEAALEQKKFDNPISQVVGYDSILKKVSASDDDPQRYLIDQITEIRETLNHIKTDQQIIPSIKYVRRRLDDSPRISSSTTWEDIQHEEIVYEIKGSKNRLEQVIQNIKNNADQYGIQAFSLQTPSASKNVIRLSLRFISENVDKIVESILMLKRKYNDLEFEQLTGPETFIKM